MRSPKDCSYTFKKIAECLDTIGILADVLAENTIARDASDDGSEQIGCRGETGVQSAIRLIAYAAHAEFCQLATDLGVPE